MDYILLAGAGAVLLVALMLGGSYMKFNRKQSGKNVLMEVGNQLSEITLVGEQGLLAVSDAQKAQLEKEQLPEATPTPQPSEGYKEEEYKTEVAVGLSLTSIEKDLKIKFLNNETGKLIGNVPFSVEVISENGTSYFWSDDDMDGIIYKKKLSGGMYTVKVNAFSDDKYRKYSLKNTEQRVEVKETIEYKKVDVAAEIKSESQVDVKKEDTKNNESIKEEYLADTVSWVESTITEAAYLEISKDNIPDPLTLAFNGWWSQITALNVVQASELATPSMPPAETTPPAENPTDVPSENPTNVPAETQTPSGEPAPTITPPTETLPPTEAPTMTPVPSAEPSPSPSMSPSPSPLPVELSIGKKEETVYIGTPVELEVTVKNGTEASVIMAESSDTAVAKVQVNGKKVRIEGLLEGKADITIKAQTGEQQSAPVVCTVTVKNDPKTNTTKVLKDLEGRPVYVAENNTYRQAYYADYYTASKFYILGEVKYTGWQVIDGYYRYYDAAGKYVTGEQVIQGVKYSFNDKGYLNMGTGVMGIDVSKWNGTIDWKAVKNAGVSYAIIRCGYRGSSQGALIKDSKFEENIKGATNAGIKVGIYFFTQAIDKTEAVEEASMVLECIRNYNITYPVFLDVEPSGSSSGRADRLDVTTRTEICKAFCETIRQYGYTPGIYANKTWLETKLDMNVLNSYKIWLAQYASAPTYQGRYDMWQYKSTGKISGISTDVDLNMSYLGY